MADHIENLIETLLGGTAQQREAAAIALGESNDRRAIEPLRRACYDTDHYVREAAKKALRRFGESESPSSLPPKAQPREIKDPDREKTQRKIETALSNTKTTEHESDQFERTGEHRHDRLLIKDILELKVDMALDTRYFHRCVTAKYKGKQVFADGLMSDNVFIRGEWEAVLDQHLAELEAERSAGGSA